MPSMSPNPRLRFPFTLPSSPWLDALKETSLTVFLSERTVHRSMASFKLPGFEKPPFTKASEDRVRKKLMVNWTNSKLAGESNLEFHLSIQTHSGISNVGSRVIVVVISCQVGALPMGYSSVGSLF